VSLFPLVGLRVALPTNGTFVGKVATTVPFVGRGGDGS